MRFFLVLVFVIAVTASHVKHSHFSRNDRMSSLLKPHGKHHHRALEQADVLSCTQPSGHCWEYKTSWAERPGDCAEMPFSCFERGYPCGPLGVPHRGKQFTTREMADDPATCSAQQDDLYGIMSTDYLDGLETKHKTTGNSITMPKVVKQWKQFGDPYGCEIYAGSHGSCTVSNCKKTQKGKNKNVLASSGCGAVSAAVVAAWYTPTIAAKDPAYVANWFVSHKYRNGGAPKAHRVSGATCSGTSHLGIEKFGEAHGFRVKWHYSKKRSKIQNLLAEGPLVFHVKKKEDESGTNLCKFTGGGHYIVVYAWDDTKSRFKVQDVGSGKQVRTYGTEEDLFTNCKNAGYASFRPWDPALLNQL